MTTTEPRIGNWMQTYTGRAFWPLDPRPEDINPLDIAHALGHLCRYGGHVRKHYSVAEHCLLLSQAVSPENALWALLHDATEAYIGDMVRPLKQMMPHFQTVEDNLMDVICYRFELEPEMPEEVHQADARILVNEKNALMGPSPLPWEQDGLEPLAVEIRALSAYQASNSYMARLNELLLETQ